LELEFRISTEQGEERVVHSVGRDDPSRPGRSRGTVQDVTDQRRAEAERSELLQTAARADEARRLNAELEQRVAARTAELERIRAGAVRMGELIDVVLELSRLSRRHLVREQVDLSALASEIAAELRHAEPDRQVDVEIQDGLLAEADLALVRSILQNLLANAYKFTSRTQHARVRFEAVEDSVVPVFFVADNGAGFDMAHAKSLFRPFHRLHQNSEFPGEGIGLATVVRAAHRHGGVVWGHGAVNQGAIHRRRRTPNGLLADDQPTPSIRRRRHRRRQPQSSALTSTSVGRTRVPARTPGPVRFVERINAELAAVVGRRAIRRSARARRIRGETARF
jgi:signal transduction histidine kinase